MGTMNLTDDDFWKGYWRDKASAFSLKVTDKYLFADIIRAYIPRGIQTFMELGGFPGYFSVLFKKLYGADAKLCDIYVDENAVKTLCKANEVADIGVIRENVFNLRTSKVDVVLSAGLVEHFANPAEIIKKHFEFVNEGGYVIIGVPNFLGLNGWVQKWADRKLYDAHNLDAMRLATLIGACEANDAEVIYANYYGKFGIWLENFQGRSFATRAFLSLVNKVRYLIWFESRMFSPYIICIARKRIAR